MLRLTPARILTFWALAGGVIALAAPVMPADVASLQQKLASADPAARSALLVELSAKIEGSNTKQSLAYAQGAKAAAETPLDELRAQARIAAVQRALGQYVPAMANARDGLDKATQRHDDVLRALFLLDIARVQWSLTQLPESIATFRQVIPLAESVGDKEIQCDAHYGLELAYADANQRDEQKREIEATLALAVLLGDSSRQGNALTGFGNYSLALKDYAAAQDYHEKARQAYLKAGDTRGVATALVNLGSTAEDRGDLAAAKACYDQARAAYETLGLNRQLANTYMQIGSVQRKMGLLDPSLSNLQTSLALARPLHSHMVMAKIWKEFSLLYEQRGDLPAALKAERQLAVEREAGLGERARDQLGRLNAQYGSERRQHEIELLQSQRAEASAELERVRWQRYGLMAVLVVGIVAVGAVGLLHRQKLHSERKAHEQSRAARDAAEQADRMKTRLLGIASHDLKGPLGNIRNLVEELSAEPGPGGAVDERLNWIGIESTRLLRLVQDLLDTAALDTGKLELRLAPVDLVDVVRAVAAEQQWQIADKSQTLYFSPPPSGEGMVQGDRDRLHQVIGNLVGNAIKFAPKEKPITITLVRRDDRVLLSVHDEGPGLTVEDRGRIFAAFTRLTAQPTGRESSHGLGLSIAQEIVRLHGGEITVDSQPGSGATFTINLPAGSA